MLPLELVLLALAKAGLVIGGPNDGGLMSGSPIFGPNDDAQ